MKMNGWRRAINLVVALALIMSCVPMAAFAVSKELGYLIMGGTSIVKAGQLQSYSLPAGASYDEASNTLTLNSVANGGYITTTGSVDVHVTGSSVLGADPDRGFSLRQIGQMSQYDSQMNLRIEPGVTLTLQGTAATASTAVPSFNPDGVIYLSGGGSLIVQGSGNGNVVNNGGFLRMDGNVSVAGDFTLSQGMTVADDETMTIQTGAVLHIGNGVTLTIDGNLTNHGTIALTGSGRVVSNGTIIDNGTITVDGTAHTHRYDSVPTYEKITGTDNHIKSVTCTNSCPIHAVTTQTQECSGGTANCCNLAKCDYCTAGYGKVDTGNHTWQYTAQDHIVTEICANGCGHNVTATLITEKEAYTYTGSAITPATIAYSDGWAGEKPGNDSITYVSNINAGTAAAKITVAGKELTKAFRIDPADIADATVTVFPDVLDYGEVKPESVSVLWNGVTLKENVDYTIQWDKTPIKDAGTYTATVTGIGNFTGTTIGQRVVNPANLTGVKVEQVGTLTYNGEAQTPTVSTSATTVDGTEVTFTYSTELEGPYGSMPAFENEGRHDVWYRVAAENHVTQYGSFLVTVEQATNEWTAAPSLEGWIYGESANAPTGMAKFGTVSIVYRGTANDGTAWESELPPVKAGIYTATFTVKDTDNYSGLEKSVHFTIAKADYDMSGAKWDYTEAFKYDGKSHTVWFDEDSLPDGVFVSNYTGNTASAVGKYTANVSLSYDYDNYNHPNFNTLLEWEIKNDWTPAEYTVSTPNENGWLNDEFVITPADGYYVSLTNTADGTWEDQLTDSAETSDGSVTFYLKNANDGTISLEKTVTYKIDMTPATGKVEFVDRTGWESFVNTITFGLFYKDEVTVKIEASDALSSVARVEYYAADKAMTLEEVKAITDWTGYNGGFGVAAEDTKQFVYFVRITDNADNVTYLSTDGAEYDTTAPVISGAEAGKICYTTQKVAVTDKNLETVTVNGTPVIDPSEFSLPGNTEAEFVVSAIDKAGNETTVTVTMKPLAALNAPVKDITVNNVTWSDLDAVETLMETIEGLNVTNATDEELEELKSIQQKGEALQARLDALETALSTEDIEGAIQVTQDNVKLEDKEALEQAKEELEKAAEDFAPNLTDGLGDVIREQLERIEAALKIIESAEAVQDIIDALPATAQPDDETSIAAAEAALQAYEALTQQGKTMVNADKLNALLDALSIYKIVAGDGGVWIGEGNLSMTANGAYSKFAGIQVDGKAVDVTSYEAVSGSTVVTLKEKYLKTLSEGKHTLTVCYPDGQAVGSFTVDLPSTTPDTGDAVNPMVLLMVSLLALTAMAALLVIKRKAVK